MIFNAVYCFYTYLIFLVPLIYSLAILPFAMLLNLFVLVFCVNESRLVWKCCIWSME